MSRIGIGVTTYNRPEILADTLEALNRWRPPNSTLTVVDDHSRVPTPEASYHQWNRGVAASKNHCLETLLADPEIEHIFLFDDDTRPTQDEWWVPYIESPEPHLMHQFAGAPDHWPLHQTHIDPDLVAYDRPRGCMLYVERRVLRMVGGMHVAFGRHGGEHEDWSRRIYEAGFTRYPFADVPTKTIECLDETQTDISSLPIGARQDWRNVDARSLGNYAEYRYLPVPVLVPYRPDEGHRDALWSWLRTHYWGEMRGYRVVEGCSPIAWVDHDDGHAGGYPHPCLESFNRSRAINDAARSAGNWEHAVIADADTWVPRAQLDEALALSRRTGKIVSALDSVIELTEESTESVLDGLGSAMMLGTDRVRTDPITTQSSMIVVPRTAWERIGGFDEAFDGWGGEDNAFWRAAEILCTPPLRVPGAAFHLWHPARDVIERQSDPGYRRNLERFKDYAAATCECSLRRVRNS